MIEKDEIFDAPRILVCRYRLDDLAATSRFAQIWRAFDLKLQRVVAVKVSTIDHQDDIEEITIDAQRTSNLKHPGIVPILDVQCEEGICCRVCEFFEGGSLRDFVGRPIVSNEQIVRWMSDVTEALEYAHSNGVIHGNIKPSNILIGLDGRAVLADFGMPKSVTAKNKTLVNAGVARYQSPEQIEGKLADARSDLYSLGVVLHELLTGNLPYKASDPKLLQSEIVRGAQVDSLEISRAFRKICQKVLQRDPEKRYSCANQLDAVLRRTLVKSSTRQVMIGVIGVIVFAIGFWLSSWWTSEKPIPPQVLSRIEADWFARVAALPAKDQIAAVSMRLMELNPGFDGEVKETIDDGVVTEIEFITDNVKDISPVRVLAGLKSLSCFGTSTEQSNGQLTDLFALKGLSLSKLLINDNERIEDLSPLEAMPLTFLHCRKTNVEDLSPLKGLPLTFLNCGLTRVSNLSPLARMQLKELYCDHTAVTDLTPLEGMPLEQLHCHVTPLTSLSSLTHSPLKVLDCHRTLVAELFPIRGLTNLVSLNILSTKVEDLSPLNELPKIKLLWCDFDVKRDADVLRSLKSLEFINDNRVNAIWPDVPR